MRRTRDFPLIASRDFEEPCVGGGVVFPPNDSIGIGSQMLANIIASETLDERIYFSWEVLSVRYRF